MFLAETPTPEFFVANGNVNDVEIDGDTLYVAGDFDTVGRPTGPFVVVDAVTGRSYRTRAELSGIVRAVVDDGQGGWILAGDFHETHTGEQHLLWIDAAGRPTGLSTHGLSIGVDVLLRDGQTLYLGGRFATVLGAPRAGLAAFDLVSRSLLSFDPLAVQVFADQNDVDCLALIDGMLLVGGDLDLGTTAQGPYLVGVDVAANAITWQPQLNGRVQAVCADATSIYVGGAFTLVEGATRSRLASFRRADHALAGFAPALDGVVLALLVLGDHLFVAGRFQNVGATPRLALASFDLVSSALTPWQPALEYWNGVTREVQALTTTGANVLAGGRFLRVNTDARRCVVSLDPVTGECLPFDVHLVGVTEPYVAGFAHGGGRLALAGNFRIAGEGFTPGIAALDLRTGRPRPGFRPEIYGRLGLAAPGGVNACVVRGDTIYIGGSFYTVDGANRRLVATIDKHTGRLLPAFDARLDGPPNGLSLHAFALASDRLFLFGEFRSPNLAYQDFVAVELTQGNLLTSFQPGVDPSANLRAFALALSHDEQTVYVGGHGFVFGPQYTPRDRLAALDATTGVLLPFDPGANQAVHSLLALPDRLWVGGHFSQLGGQTHFGLGSIDLATGLAIPFVTDVGGAPPSGALALHLDGGALVAGGRFAGAVGAGGQPGGSRENLARFHERSGLLEAWSGRAGSEVLAIDSDARHLVVGGAFTGTSTGYRPGFLVFRRGP